MPVNAKYPYSTPDGRRLAKNIDMHCQQEVWAVYKYGLSPWKEPWTGEKTHKKERKNEFFSKKNPNPTHPFPEVVCLLRKKR